MSYVVGPRLFNLLISGARMTVRISMTVRVRSWESEDECWPLIVKCPLDLNM